MMLVMVKSLPTITNEFWPSVAPHEARCANLHGLLWADVCCDHVGLIGSESKIA